MVSLLIAYVADPDHPDPMLNEFTYGDINSRGRRLKRLLRKGDYVFFQGTTGRKRYITAYYIVDRVLDTGEAANNKLIRAKYKNPHISLFLAGRRCPDDVLLFGDPILSRKLERPLLFDRALARKLSLKIHFTKERTELFRISSHTRAFRELSKDDERVLLREIRKIERKKIRPNILLSTDEIQELTETDLEELISKRPDLLGERGLKLKERQYELTPKDRIDLLLTDAQGDYVIVELKPDMIGRDALTQTRRYLHRLRNQLGNKTNKKVRAIIVCKGIMPAFSNVYGKLRDVSIRYYGWKIAIASSEID
jgi:putative NIF3 family GTP cyclohydrolase 1 type 2